MGFVLGWHFLVVLGFASIMIAVFAWLTSLAFTASEAASVLKGVSGVVEEGVDSFDFSYHPTNLPHTLDTH
jgi:hypothetical protein